MNKTPQQEFDATLETLLSKIRESAQNQFKYNQDTNVPAGIVSAEDSATHAVKQGIASGVNNFSSGAANPQSNWPTRFWKTAIATQKRRPCLNLFQNNL